VGKEKVILRRIDGHSPSDTTRIVKDGLNEFNITPKCSGQITIKPDMVMILRQITGYPTKHKNPLLRILLKAGVVNPCLKLDPMLDAYPHMLISWCRRLLPGRL
jgi:hypothetical protein